MNRPSDDTPALPELARLRRDADVSDLEEERAVQALRVRGLLGARVRRPRRAVRLALELAAAVVLFAGGLLLGQRIGGLEPPNRVPVARPGPDAALAVQRTGSSFVNAVSRALALSPGEDPRNVAAAQESARSALRAAQTLLDRQPLAAPAQGGPHVIWF